MAVDEIRWKELRPGLSILSDANVKTIADEALGVLSCTGVAIDHAEALELLHSNGCSVEKGRVRIPGGVVEKALTTVPSKFYLFDRNGERGFLIGGDGMLFNPGSSALTVLDSETMLQREPAAPDLIRFARLTDQLNHISAQSTALVPADVPREIQDRYRLYICLCCAVKPVITGTFTLGGFRTMKEMLIMVRGSREALKKKPLAVFDCCPSSPLRWSPLTCQTLMDCARNWIPAAVVSMPLCGLTSPVTLTGTLVQLTAENLSGVVIHQLTRPGAPVIYGGSPAATDMRKGTTPMGAMETMMIDAAAARIGKYFKIPVHAYMALSDAKILDAQAGLETGMGAVMAALAGIHVVSGPGMMSYQTCQSPEKLVLDNEICGMIHRLVRGIEARSQPLAPDLSSDLEDGELFAASTQTLRWLRDEIIIPGPVIDRDTYAVWKEQGGRTLWERARDEVTRLLQESPSMLDSSLRKVLRKRLNADIPKNRLPDENF
ncbi:MAG TPA: hypothetical protein ENN03_01180 [bacterium]|nr:hypothetical protein [bacterium]